MHKGRLTWLETELQSRYGMKVSIETVSRWMKGEVRPRQAKSDRLAQLLSVDPVWLFLGVDPDMSPRERKARDAEADGVVNLVAGFIQMDGGHPAFPAAADERAKADHVDLYAIIKGASYSFHISIAQQRDDDTWHFTIPVTHDNVIVLGVVRRGFQISVVELTPDLIEKHRSGSSGGSITVAIGDADVDALKLANFANRL